MSIIRQRTIAGLTPGATFTVTRTFSESQVEQFADMTRDYNPIHFDPRFVAVKGLKARICHGLLVGGMVTEVDEKCRARAEAVLVNQDGEVVLTAHLTGRIPGKAEIQVLKQMVEEGDPTNGLR